MNKRCKHIGKDGFHRCGSYAFNLEKDDIDQGDLCDVHYWQKRALEAEALAQQEQGELVAWRTFDGEGQYEYRAYEENESYLDDWNKRNPNHKGWVDPLYTHSPKRTWVGLTNEEIGDEYVRFEVSKGGFNRFEYAVRAIEVKLKEKNT